ncbi:hypothetical protein IW261DRAFT_1553926 [Armillaria novae-zelandiae]|uniref:Uncharacterized protein n=1 Tax=Armillaria novae-zelandiae TaxID=153914 RepID=A0AA39NJ03_9AGAR|nr:hypothetical protein IW261DRAFT_1553926 [Armillaria novae-zelandiae]
MILQLKEENQSITLLTTQQGIKGNIIIYPQQPSKIASMLPPSVEEITSPLTKAKPLAVNAKNPLYKDVVLNEDVLSYLDANPMLPFSVQHIPVSEQSEKLTLRYNAPLETTCRNIPKVDAPPDDGDVPFEHVVISNVDISASLNKLRTAALSHVKSRGGGYVEITHDPTPVNEFNDPELFPLMYPTLFPYGIGDFAKSKGYL